MKLASLASLISATTLTGCIIEDPTPPNPPQQYHYCDTHDCNETPSNPNPSTGYCGDREPNPMNFELPVPGFYQECQAWCWAAAASMVTAYYGLPYSECQLVSYATNGDQSSCCSYGCGYCNRPAHYNDLARLLGMSGIHSQVRGNALTEYELRTELSNGRPVIIFFQSSFSGHFVVVSAYWTSGNGSYYYKVLDPWFGYTLAIYAQLRYGYQNGQAYWGASIYRLSPRADGCNEYFDPSCGCDDQTPEWDEFSN